MSRYSFIAYCTLATVVTGFLIDCVTANVAVEYFTVHHPKLVESQSPWVMALVWGFSASWWFAVPSALVIDVYNSRRHAPVTRNQLLRWVIIGLASIWLFMMTILASVYALISLVPVHQRKPDFESVRRLMAVAVTHQFEYVLGAILVIILLLKIRSHVPNLDS